MREDDKNMNKFPHDHMNGSWFKIRGTNFGGPVHERNGGEFFKFYKKIQETPMRKDEKKSHSKFYHDQMNGSWFEIGGTNFGSSVQGGKFWNCWKIPKNTYGKDEKKTYNKFYRDRMDNVGFKSWEPMLEGENHETIPYS